MGRNGHIGDAANTRIK